MALQDKNSFADVWEQLDAKYAERVRVTDAAALGDEEIVRRWPQIGEGYLSKCLTALSLFTDSKNSKPQLWVKDPVVGRETFPGTYRVVTVDVDVQKPGLKGIIQTLRKGFAESPQWTEARIERKIAALSNTVGVAGISGTTSDPVDQVFDVLFPNCSPLAIESIAAALRAGNYSGGITVRGEPHSGAWHVISVSTKTEEDGSATATLRVATPQYTITAYDDYGLDRAMDVHYVMDVPKDQAQGIVNAWKAAHEVGASATVSYSRDQKLVDIVLRKTAAAEHEFDVGLSAADCRYLETETIYLNVSSPSLYPISAPTNGAGVSYTRNVTRNINGTWDITIKTRTARYRDSGNAVVEVSAAQSTQQRQQLGVTTQGIETLAETPGIVKSQRIEIRDDCSKDVTTNAETGKPLVTTEKTVARSYEETTTATQTASAVLPVPVTATGFIKTVRNEQSKYPSRWNVMERIRHILHIATAVIYDNRDDAAAHEQTVESIGVPNSGGVAVVLSAASGKSLSARVRYDKESDTLDVEKTTEDGKPQTGSGVSENNLEASVETLKINANSESAPVATAGQAIDFKIDPTKYADRHVVRATVRTGKPLTVTTEIGNNLETINEERALCADASADPAVAAGQIVDFDKRPSQFKDKFDTSKTVRTGVEKTVDFTISNADENEHVVNKTTANDAVPPAAGTGERVEFDKRPSQYKDKFDVRTVVKTGVARNVGGAAGWISHYDGSARHYVEKLMLNVPEASIPVANEKGERVDVSPAPYKGLVNVRQTRVVLEPWFLDFDEPTVSGRHPRFNRKVFWLADSSTIQSYVDAFLAKVAAVVNEQYSITASVGRDENGYYNLDLSANPEKAGGGAGDWDTGQINFTIPWCRPRSAFIYAKATVTYTNNRIKVQQLLTDAAKADLIEHGAGETTGVYYLGRGRYKVAICKGQDATPSYT